MARHPFSSNSFPSIFGDLDLHRLFNFHLHNPSKRPQRFAPPSEPMSLSTARNISSIRLGNTQPATLPASQNSNAFAVESHLACASLSPSRSERSGGSRLSSQSEHPHQPPASPTYHDNSDDINKMNLEGPRFGIRLSDLLPILLSHGDVDLEFVAN